MSKFKSQISRPSLRGIYSRSNLIILLGIASLSLAMTWHSNIFAVSPTSTPTATPTIVQDENVKEIRDAIKEKVTEIKEKFEKKAYVGIIFQITDSTLTLDSFRGKQRVRLIETTKIISSGKEIKATDLAVGDKVIAMGDMTENDILEAKRVIVVPKPKTVPAIKLSFFGKITEIDIKNTIITLVSPTNLDNTINLKVDNTAKITLLSDLKAKVKFLDFKQDQKIIAIYLQPASGKTAIVKSIFILP